MTKQWVIKKSINVMEESKQPVATEDLLSVENANHEIPAVDRGNQYLEHAYPSGSEVNV